mgnify:FL=1
MTTALSTQVSVLVGQVFQPKVRDTQVSVLVGQVHQAKVRDTQVAVLVGVGSTTTTTTVTTTTTIDPSTYSGDICWGHDTGVEEDNTANFYGSWTGTGSIEETGDNEKVGLLVGEYEVSHVHNFGSRTAKIQLNKYKQGEDDFHVHYRTGATEVGLGEYLPYREPFTSSGYVQIAVARGVYGVAAHDPDLFVTNFSEDDVISDFTEEWGTGGYWEIIQVLNTVSQPAVGRKSIIQDFSTTTNYRKYASYNPAGSASSDQEILALVAMGDIDSDGGFTLNLRSGGTTTSDCNSYLLKINGYSDTVEISKYVSGAGTILTSGALEPPGSVPYWIRFRVEGTTLKAKLWEYYLHEPYNWHLSTTDSSLSSGTVGMGNYDPDTVEVFWFGVHTNKGTVPVPQLTNCPYSTPLTELSTGRNTSSRVLVNQTYLCPAVVPYEADGKIVRSIKFWIEQEAGWNVRYAVYKGSSQTDVTDAVLMEDLGRLIADSTGWHEKK